MKIGLADISPRMIQDSKQYPILFLYRYFAKISYMLACRKSFPLFYSLSACCNRQCNFNPTKLFKDGFSRRKKKAVLMLSVLINLLELNAAETVCEFAMCMMGRLSLKKLLKSDLLSLKTVFPFLAEYDHTQTLLKKYG